jgi:hypothetical protein
LSPNERSLSFIPRKASFFPYKYHFNPNKYEFVPKRLKDKLVWDRGRFSEDVWSFLGTKNRRFKLIPTDRTKEFFLGMKKCCYLLRLNNNKLYFLNWVSFFPNKFYRLCWNYRRVFPRLLIEWINKWTRASDIDRAIEWKSLFFPKIPAPKIFTNFLRIRLKLILGGWKYQNKQIKNRNLTKIAAVFIKLNKVFLFRIKSINFARIWREICLVNKSLNFWISNSKVPTIGNQYYQNTTNWSFFANEFSKIEPCCTTCKRFFI